MSDLFADKAHDYDSRPVPAQISAGLSQALAKRVAFDPSWTVLDFGAGTGLVCAHVAPRVARVIAVDISQAMLDKLAQKEALRDRVEIRRQDILTEPLDHRVDLVVSAMALHHVENTPALLAAFYEHLEPGGRIALADLDAEDGDFHPPDIKGVFHAGFDRTALRALIEQAGFVGVRFSTACEVEREGKTYPIFLVTASRPS